MPSHFIGILSLGPCILFLSFLGVSPAPDRAIDVHSSSFIPLVQRGVNARGGDTHRLWDWMGPCWNYDQKSRISDARNMGYRCTAHGPSFRSTFRVPSSRFIGHPIEQQGTGRVFRWPFSRGLTCLVWCTVRQGFPCFHHCSWSFSDSRSWWCQQCRVFFLHHPEWWFPEMGGTSSHHPF